MAKWRDACYKRDTSVYKYQLTEKPCKGFSQKAGFVYLAQVNLKDGQLLCQQIFSLDRQTMQLINPGNGIIAEFIKISNDH